MMQPLPQRKAIRLPHFDYGQEGAYFITGCTHRRQHLFGSVSKGIMCLNDLGSLVWEEWDRSFALRPDFRPHAFVVMPNHWHALFSIIRPAGVAWDEHRIAEFGKPAKDTISRLAGGLKSAVTSRAKIELGITNPIWQSRFHDHVVRNEAEFIRIEQYIHNNPRNWNDDCFHP